MIYPLLKSVFQIFNSSCVFVAFAYKRHVRERLLRGTKTRVPVIGFSEVNWTDRHGYRMPIYSRDILARTFSLVRTYCASQKANINVDSFNEINGTYISLAVRCLLPNRQFAQRWCRFIFFLSFESSRAWDTRGEAIVTSFYQLANFRSNWTRGIRCRYTALVRGCYFFVRSSLDGSKGQSPDRYDLVPHPRPRNLPFRQPVSRNRDITAAFYSDTYKQLESSRVVEAALKWEMNPKATIGGGVYNRCCKLFSLLL